MKKSMQGDRAYEEGWPVQRIRLAIGATLFFGFEVLFARQLPLFVTFSILALGVISTISAFYAIHDLRVRDQADYVLGALDERALLTSPGSRRAPR